MFGRISGQNGARPLSNMVPKNKTIQRVLGGLRNLKMANAKTKEGMASAGTQQNRASGQPTVNAFQAANEKSAQGLKNIRVRNTKMYEGQKLRSLQKSLVNIEAEITKESKKANPNHSRIDDLKTLWAQDNDKMMGAMQAIISRERGAHVNTSKAMEPVSVRSLEDYNNAEDATVVSPVDRDANAELKRMSALRGDVELELASATDGDKKRSLEKLLTDVDKRVLDLTNKALGG